MARREGEGFWVSGTPWVARLVGTASPVTAGLVHQRQAGRGAETRGVLWNPDPKESPGNVYPKEKLKSQNSIKR